MKKKLVVLTGAGMSAESGISTFRDTNGLWENYRVEDVATPEGFAYNPELVLDIWAWLLWKKILMCVSSRRMWITYTNRLEVQTLSICMGN